MALRLPLNNYTVTQGFGANSGYYKQFGQNGHNGIDLGANAGTPVYAADDGTIAFEGWGQNHSWIGSIAGISVIIRHSNVHSAYAHLLRTVVDKGQAVKKGQLIGFVGATGTATGPHTHFEVLPLSPNFSNGYAGRVDPTPYVSTVNVATVEQIRQAYRDILGREADAGGIATYSKFSIDFVRSDLAASNEKREIDARRAREAQAAAEKKATDAARWLEEARIEAERLEAEEAALRAAEEKARVEVELARIEEEERLAQVAAEERAKQQQIIEKTATPSGVPMTTSELETLGNEDEPTTVTRGEAMKSASLFVARIYTQYLAGQVIAQGVFGIALDALGWVAPGQVVGITALAITAFLIFWAQFGYQLAQGAGWKWAANLKWPF